MQKHSKTLKDEPMDSDISQNKLKFIMHGTLYPNSWQNLLNKPFENNTKISWSNLPVS